MNDLGMRLLVVSVDKPAKSQEVIDRFGLKFTFLSDPEGRVIREYGVLHAGGGPGGEDIALPAHFLIDRNGSIVWRRISDTIQDRPSPKEILEVGSKRLR